MDDGKSPGENVELSGFDGLDLSAMLDVKRIVETRERQFRKKCGNVELLKLTMKRVHGQEHSEKYEIHAMLVQSGKRYTATVTDRNLFFAVENSLSKVENETGK